MTSRTEPKLVRSIKEAIKHSRGKSVVVIGDRQYRWKSVHDLENLEAQLPMGTGFAVVIRRPYGGWYIITQVT